MQVTRTERGWPGHFIGSHSCTFRRNTLLEYCDKRIVVSTVGAYRPAGLDRLERVGLGRYYETMAFRAQLTQEIYYDADVSRQIYIDGKWEVGHVEPHADAEANDMHEAAVAEIISRLESGEI